VADPAICKRFSHFELERHHRTGDLTIERDFYRKTIVTSSLGAQESLEGLSRATRMRVLWLKALCERFLAMEADGRASRTTSGFEDFLAPSLAQVSGRDESPLPSSQISASMMSRSLQLYESWGVVGLAERLIRLERRENLGRAVGQTSVRRAT
jgi:hypothetical protein